MSKSIYLIGLDEMFQRYRYVFFDTSSISHFLDSPFNIADNSTEILSVKRGVKAISRIVDFARDKGGIYLTSGVGGELVALGSNFSPQISSCFYKSARVRGRTGISKLSYAKKNNRRPFINAVLKRTKKALSLLEILTNQGNILNFKESEGQTYQDFVERYSFCKNKVWGKVQRPLSEVDFDLVVHGSVSAITYGSTCLVCNDFAAYGFWKYILKDQELNDSQFGFFIRKKIDGYSKAFFKE